MIQDDIKALRQHIDEKPAELIIPEFIMDPQIRAEALQLLKFAEKYETFDILDVKVLLLMLIVDSFVANSCLQRT